MSKRIAIVGAGALGGYVGGTLAHLGHDVTLIDAWPEHIETIRSRGLELDGMTPEERFVVKKAKTMHLTEVQTLAKRPVDVCAPVWWVFVGAGAVFWLPAVWLVAHLAYRRVRDVPTLWRTR